jgi:hypothetical protein
MAPKYEVKGKGTFSISRENLLSQLALQRAKPPSAERDAMLAHMESLLGEMDG